MYLAIADEVINKRQKALSQYNERLIKDFEELPFWKRWGKEEELKQEIISNWRYFETWMDSRIQSQSIK